MIKREQYDRLISAHRGERWQPDQPELARAR